MCPKEAKVFVAEDEEKWHENYRIGLDEEGHKIFVNVYDLKEGLSSIPEAKKLGINVALIDGRLPYDAEDGNKLAGALREAIPEIKIVDISGFGDAIKNPDAVMAKSKFKIFELGKLVTDL